MSLIKCTYCGHMISEKAERCPQCGTPVERRGAYQPIQENPSFYETRSKSHGWLYALVGILGTLLVVAMVHIYNSEKDADTDIENGNTQPSASVQQQADTGAGNDNTQPSANTQQQADKTETSTVSSSRYLYKGYWRSSVYPAQPCQISFKRRGDILTNCKYTNLRFNYTVPLYGTVDGDTLRFRNSTNKYSLEINVAVPEVTGGNLVGYGIDYKHSGDAASLDLQGGKK